MINPMNFREFFTFSARQFCQGRQPHLRRISDLGPIEWSGEFTDDHQKHRQWRAATDRHSHFAPAGLSRGSQCAGLHHHCGEKLFFKGSVMLLWILSRFISSFKLWINCIYITVIRVFPLNLKWFYEIGIKYYKNWLFFYPQSI